MPDLRTTRLDDPQRLDELQRFRAAALSSGSHLPDVIEAARYAFRGTIAALSCVGPESTCFAGMASDVGDVELEVPTRLAFCRRVVETGEPFIAKNLIVDPDYSDNPYVTQPPYTRFYAGVPVRTPSGLVLGAFAVLSQEPSFRFNAEDLAALQRFASIALSMVTMRADLRAVA